MAGLPMGAQEVQPMCGKHSDEKKVMYCKKCKISTCTECLKEDHLGHDVKTILEFSQKLINDHSSLFGDLSGKFSKKTKRRIQKFHEVKCQNYYMHSNNMKSLEEERKTLHRIIDDLIDTEVTKCQLYDSEHQRKLEEMDRNCSETERTIQNMLDKFNKTTMTGFDFIEYYENLKDRIESMEVPNMEHCFNRLGYQEKYFRSKADIILQNVVGGVQELKCKVGAVKELSSFSDKNKIAVHTIRPMSEDSARLSFAKNEEQEVPLLNAEGTQLESQKYVTANPSFLVSNSNEFIVADYDKKVILKKKSATVDEVIMRTNLCPRHVGKALNENIFVTLVDEWSNTRTPQSQRKVLMVTPGGKVIQSYEFGNERSEQIFVKPCRPIQNYNSNVCIINQFEVTIRGIKGRRGTLCIFFEDGDLKTVYDHGGEGDFNPTDVCCDSLCNIMCASSIDQNNHSVHIINSEGIFLKYLLTSTIIRSLPSSIAMYKNKLWVGSDSGKVTVFRYQIE